MSQSRARLLGLGFGLLGYALIWWSWHDATADGKFAIEAGFLGPLFLGFGSDFLLEAPKRPVDRPSILGWIYSIAGLILGLLHAAFLGTGILGSGGP